MADQRIFLHIGTHKTATTTIQAGCCENREALLAAGWLYPTTGMYLYGQHNIAWEMCSGHEQPWNHVNQWVRFRPNWGGIQQLLDEIKISSARNIILSSEDFDGLQTDRIDLLREHLKDFDVEVIVYLREQASFLQSAWAQFVKSGYVVESFPDFIDRMLASDGYVLRYFGAYDLFLTPWMTAFGAEHVHPKPFSRDAFQGHIFYDFLTTCELPRVTEFKIPANQNISPGFKTLEIMRLMGQNVVSMEKRSLVTNYIQQLGHVSGWDDGKLNLISPALHERIQARFGEANHFLQEVFYHGEPFFNTQFKAAPLSTFDNTAMTGAEWEEIARSITTHLINNHLESVNLYEVWEK